MRTVNTIHVLDIFCSCYALLLQLLAKHSSAALPYVSTLLTSTCKPVNDSSVH